jgi:hypothetical protein
MPVDSDAVERAEAYRIRKQTAVLRYFSRTSSDPQTSERISARLRTRAYGRSMTQTCGALWSRRTLAQS